MSRVHRNLRQLAFISILALTSSLSFVYGQSKSNKGKDFWVGYMLHYSGSTAGHSLYITSDSSTTGTVSVPGQSWSQSYTVTANTVTVVTIPSSVVYNSCSDCITSRGVHITAVKDVVVYSHQYLGNQSDATLVLPTRTLGKDYYAMGYLQNSTGNTGRNVFCVIAVKDSTKIRITPKVTITKNGGGTLPANTPYMVTLNAGELYQGVASAGTSTFDITGTHIEVIDTGATADCRTIAVFSGSSYTTLGGCSGFGSGDNLCEQMYATNSWGSKFVLVPALGRTGDNYRFVASQDGTEVIAFKSIGAPISYYINKGQYADITNESEVRYIVATKPIMVGQFQRTAGCDGGGNRVGDPSMTILNPLEQTLKDITLYSSRYFDITNHYINVVIPAYATSSFRIDGASATFTPVPKNAAYSYARLTVSAGNHRLTADAGFIATAYGEGDYESYGYAAGANIKDLTAVAKVTNSAQNNEISNCLGLATQFSGSAEYTPVSWGWNFGDGTTNTVQNPTHTYTDTGTYIATLYSYKPAYDGCSNFDSSQVEIKIYGIPTAKISRGRLCDSISTTFIDKSTFPTPEKHLNTSWSINDGSFGYDTVYTHLFDTFGKFKLTMTVTSEHQCSATITDSIVVNPNPVALFSPKKACYYDSTYLISTSTIATGRITDYKWVTAASDTANKQAFNYYLNSTGYLGITLTVQSDSGCTGAVTDSIYKYPRLDVSFTSNDTCLGIGNTFTNTSTKAGGLYTDTTWYTSVPDTAYTYHYNKQFDNVGTYDVSLIMEIDSFCSDTFTKSVIISPLPVPDFNFSNTCLGDSTRFIDASSLSSGTYTRAWTLGDGFTSTLGSPKVKYTSSSIKNVKLTLTTNKGCVRDTTKQVKITNPQILGLIKANGCAGTVQDISSTNSVGLDSFAAYNWTINGTTISTDSTFSNLRTGDGVKRLQLTVTSKNGCVISRLDSFEVFTAPKAIFTVSEVCNLDNLTPMDASTVTAPSTITGYSWSVNGTFTSNSQFPTIPTSTAGTKSIKLVTTNNEGCKDSVTNSVEVRPLPAGGFTAVNLCVGETTIFATSATISAGNVASTVWQIDGSTFSGPAPEYIFPNAGSFNISQISTSDYGCTDTLNQPVVINPLPLLDIDLDNYEGCVPFNVTVNNNSIIASGTIANYLWFWGDGSTNTGTAVNGYTYPTVDTYTITVVAESDKGCRDSITLAPDVTVFARPKANFVFSPLEPSNITEFVTLKDTSSADVVDWEWNISDGVIYDGLPVVLHHFEDSGNYVVNLKVINADGCTDSITKIIYVNADLFVHIPSAFSPNGDLINDEFGLAGLTQGVVKYNIKIFNRWGEQVYESSDVNKKWDGKYKGEEAEQGLYFYLIEFTNPKQTKWYYFNGDLHL
jgi:gliding motility-associated-like protein